ncbi:MAG TPA: hypothetical protein VG796_26410 [Verrucomicrobiales bacterium]|nr:hypothetical protein [Verrucomicrobiales bacterium]
MNTPPALRHFVAVLGFTSLFTGRAASEQPSQPWAGAALTDWSNASRAIVLSDLSGSQPAEALSTGALQKNRWKVIPYEMANNGYTGKMIWAGAESNAPEVSLPLDTEGWHAIFVGIFSATEVPSKALIRLDSDPSPVPRYNRRESPTPYSYGHSEDVFFRAINLQKNNRLLFSPQNTGTRSACGITHVKLIPLTEEEGRRVEADARDTTHRTLAATNDGFSDFFHRSPRTESALLSSVEVFRDTDFGTLILQAGGADKVNYPSTAGFQWGSNTETFPVPGHRHFVESTRALAEQKINPVKALTQRAQAIGIKVHVALRPAGWSFFEPYTDFWESPFYQNHPEWRCEDREGTPVTRMSWAVPEVRKHLIELLRGMVQFGADGANLVFTRGYPLVLYETPARKLFEEKHHEDLRKIDEFDPRLTAFRSDIVTGFIQELRVMLDEEQKRRGNGQRLALSLLINASAQDDLFFGVDLRRLAAAKLIDAVFTEHGFGATDRNFNLPFLREVCLPARIPFNPGIYNAGTRYKSVLPAFYESGAHGLTVWDAEVDDIYEWCWISRFGHREETEWRIKNLDLKKAPRSFYLFHKLGNQTRDSRYGPHWGG